jgi:hypothetical protein
MWGCSMRSILVRIGELDRQSNLQDTAGSAGRVRHAGNKPQNAQATKFGSEIGLVMVPVPVLL